MGNPLTVKVLKKIVTQEKLDLIFLMETKQKSNKLELLRQKMGFTNGTYVEPEGRSGGLCLWWNDDWDIQIKHISANFIDVLINENTQ